jgi:hypothetical protein
VAIKEYEFVAEERTSNAADSVARSKNAAEHSLVSSNIFQG